MTSNSPRSSEGTPTKKRRENREGPAPEGSGYYPNPQHYGYAQQQGGPTPQYGGYPPHYPPSGPGPANYSRGGPPPSSSMYCQPAAGAGPYIHNGQPPPGPSYSRPWNGNDPTSFNSNSSGKTPLRNSHSPQNGEGLHVLDSVKSAEAIKKEKEEMQAARDKGRGSYRCGKCGVPKKGHICPYQPKLKRRSDEPPPEMRNAATQVEMDEFLVVRRLNLEIQGFPESYTAAPMDNVGTEVHPPPLQQQQQQPGQGQAQEMGSRDPSSMGMMAGMDLQGQGHPGSMGQQDSLPGTSIGTDPMKEEYMDEMGMNSHGGI
mmetsp:Transcript_5375/g.8243  ORF Transcript_5375/g.8243 Transcript_5375/m.8243 type:complete len:316 (-) Transcript_5375:46-993(-)